MKKLTAILALLFTINVGFSKSLGEEPKINFEKINEHSFKVDFENADNKKVEIQLKDKDGKVIYTEKTTADKTVRLNLINVVEGEYIFTIEMENEKLSYEFEIDK